MTTSAPVRGTFQLRFDEIERQLPTGRPLAPLKAVMFLLDKSEDDVKYLYEAGELEFAFDLSSDGASRADVRVSRDSVLRYMRGGERGKGGRGDFTLSPSHPSSLSDVIAACLPANRGPVALSDLVRLWTVSSTHLHDLCRAGELTPLPGQELKPKQTPLLTRASVAEFLKRRRIV